ncbi:hypothetical protein Cni_G27814 [Canna indica]|uniref:Uncharacterized protein n=1 Tax=Canna indica TaxID=4628 RepID=A0AAQ3L1G0_9LILI|nr:hypothetical protein Cni_G27814 [Canna indica]
MYWIAQSTFDTLEPSVKVREKMSDLNYDDHASGISEEMKMNDSNNDDHASGISEEMKLVTLYFQKWNNWIPYTVLFRNFRCLLSRIIFALSKHGTQCKI